MEPVKRSNPPVGSPAQRAARVLKRKYMRGYQISPTKSKRTRTALENIQQGMPIRQAARQNAINVSYLRRRINGRVSLGNRNGPNPIFTRGEEESLAIWLSEMAKRGMGLSRGEFLDHIANILEKDKRPNPFPDNKPGKSWFYAFMARNASKIEIRRESTLETKRSKITPATLDAWYEDCNMFLSRLHLLDKPNAVWNADETGFTMGSKSGQVIGPIRNLFGGALPHVTGGSPKSRLTVMFCGNADGEIIPPFMVYPKQKPRAYDPLIGAMRDSVIHYTKKGWMDSQTFLKFLEHFDAHCGSQRPVVLTLDSVSSHISMEIFQYARSKEIELFRIVPNATHLMQPLDVGVFGPLKKEWNKTVKKNTRENPDQPINKETFAWKLKETVMAFYKPLTVVNSFKSAGIFPVNRHAISDERLKPSFTFVVDEPEVDPIGEQIQLEPAVSAQATAFSVFEAVLPSETRDMYSKRFLEGWDLQCNSPGYDTYRKLKTLTQNRHPPSFAHGSEGAVDSVEGTHRDTPSDVQALPKISKGTTSLLPSTAGLALLADAASALCPPQLDQASVSPSVSEALRYPSAHSKKPAKKLVNQLPNRLTSSESIRISALNQLEPIKSLASREKKAKAKFLKSTSRKASKTQPTKGKKTQSLTVASSTVTTTVCIVCDGSFEEEEILGVSCTWIQCSRCMRWMHVSCIPLGVFYDPVALFPDSNIPFLCHLCDK